MEKKKSKNILLAIMGVLILLMIAVTVLSFANNAVCSILNLIALTFTAVYGFWLYKKPHGNLLKYAFLIFAVSMMVNSAIWLQNPKTLLALSLTHILSGAAICYCAGRLNRVEQNKYIFGIIEILLAVKCAIGFVGLIGKISIFAVFAYADQLIIFTTLLIAYFNRYKEHKEAGLADAPKVK